MNDTNQKLLGNTLWSIADQLRGAMDADDFRDYMLSFLFLRYLSDNYEIAAEKELGKDYPKVNGDDRSVPLALWYAANPKDVPEFEKQMRRKVHYVVQPSQLWNSIANMARTQNGELLNTLQAGFKYIETESFESTFQGLFSEIDLSSPKLGKKYEDRNAKLCTIIQKIAEGLNDFSSGIDALGDAYIYLIGQFAAGSGKKAGEFFTPPEPSDILSAIVTLDSQEPATGKRARLASVLDFACGSASLLIKLRNPAYTWRIMRSGIDSPLSQFDTMGDRTLLDHFFQWRDADDFFQSDVGGFAVGLNAMDAGLADVDFAGRRRISQVVDVNTF